MPRTGQGPAALVALEAVDAACTWGSHRPATAPATRALRHLARLAPALAPAEGYELFGRLCTPWHAAESLLVGDGNWGSPDDPPADPPFTRVGLSPLGRLALDAERGVCGPVPLDLALGDVGAPSGRFPGFGTSAVVAALDEGTALPTPWLPTGGTVDVDVDALVAGDAVTARVGCRTVREAADPDAPAWPPPLPALPPALQARVDAGDAVSYGFVTHAPQAFPGPSLVITGLPPGTGSWELQLALLDSSRGEHPVPPAAPVAVIDISDRSTQAAGTRVVIATADPAATAADLDPVESWLHAHPASHRRVTWQLPRPAAVALASWTELARADPSGLERLRRLTLPAASPGRPHAPGR